jgi:threonyl-tRNA synthetase
MTHRILMQQLDLAHIEDHSPGMVFWHPKGWKIYTLIQDYIREIHEEHGYLEVRTPILMNKSLWETSGHWEKFKENMFTVDDGEKTHALKPMSCPNHIELYDHTNRSYRELPIRYFEFGVVHRNEPSGSMHGLMRVRQFMQDDCHIICRESQILQETINYIKMVQQIYKHFGFNHFTIKLSTRPKNHFGSSELWDKSEKALADACDALELQYEIQPFESAFYGPKLEMTLVDSHGKNWQCGTIQCDYLLPSKERFNLKYTNEDGQPEQPVILHHAVLGSFERWIIPTTPLAVRSQSTLQPKSHSLW